MCEICDEHPERPLTDSERQTIIRNHVNKDDPLYSGWTVATALTVPTVLYVVAPFVHR